MKKYLELEKQEKEKEIKWCYLLGVVFTATIGAFQFGMNMADWWNIKKVTICVFSIHARLLCNIFTSGIPIKQVFAYHGIIQSLYSLVLFPTIVSSLFSVGALLGSIASGFLVIFEIKQFFFLKAKFGRKKVFHFANFLVIIGCGLVNIYLH